jgi:hypothetical protein
VVTLWQVVKNHALLVLISPFVVPQMNVTIVVPYVVVGVVPPLKSPHGLPSKEYHTSHPQHHNAFFPFALAMLLLLEVICSFMI